jgi:hypothetical protein
MSAVAHSARSTGTFWALVPVALLLASLFGVGTLSLIASRDPSFALEKNYYARAVSWEAQQAEWAENARLGYHVELDLPARSERPELKLRVTDGALAPLRGASVRVEAFANARSGERRELSLIEHDNGTYVAPLGVARPGLWEFRVTVVSHDGRFTTRLRADVPPRVHP